MPFEIARLPPEVRQLVWEATLPGPRIFHVRELAAPPPPPPPPSSPHKADRPPPPLDFHIRHPPPASHAVCRESRAVTLLRGFFFSLLPAAAAAAAGPWFNPRRDVLYLDRNMRHRLRAAAALPGLDRVLHVGLEWRAWFRDVPRAAGGSSSSRWRAAIGPVLRRHCPRAETLGFVLPRVRHAGGVPSGREPYGAERHAGRLEPLPGGARVPWERAPVVVGADAAPGLARIGGGSAPVEWRVIRRQMEAAVGEALREGEGGDGAGGSVREVRVRGWWLVRPGVPRDGEGHEVREFWS